jgi:hypothetical protein
MTGTLAISLAAAPVAAQATQAPVGRHSAPVVEDSQLRGNSTLFFLGAIVAVALGIFLLIDDDDAVSP